MSDIDKVKMTIKIGGEHLQLMSDFDKQEDVRKAEKAVSELYTQWRGRWPNRTDKEILAMVAYKFSAFYHEELKAASRTEEIASDTEKRLREVLSKMRKTVRGNQEFAAEDASVSEFDYPD